MKPSFRRFVPLLLLLAAIPLSLLLGRYPRPGFMAPGSLFSDPLAWRVFLNLRLPRVAAALLLGASLGGAGCVLQMVFRNPLVEPGFLGISQGAAFGAAGAILLFSGRGGSIQAGAVVFALLGLLLTWFIARRLRFGGWVIRMVISGICVSALFSSGIGILKYMADPLSQLQEITFWMLGGLNGITWPRLAAMLPLTLPGILIMVLMRWRLNILSLDEMTAFSLGTRPGRERMILLAAASVAVAGGTAAAGIIGWVGLLVPHLARHFYGAEGSRALPPSLILGALLVLVCDDLARAASASEIPLGILTSLFGAGLFVLLLTSRVIGVDR